MTRQLDCLKLDIRYENEGEENEIAECKKINKPMNCLQLHMRYENESEENEIVELQKTNKAMD
jgi:hypothetical protein